MKFNPKKTLKISAIGLVALGLVSTSLISVNARHKRRAYITKRYAHLHRARYKYGYWTSKRRHGRRKLYWHQYKSVVHHKHKRQIKRTKRNIKHKKIKRHTDHKKSSKIQLGSLEQPKNVDNMDNMSQFKYQTMNKINEDRINHNVKPLRENKNLHRIAQERAEQSANLDYLTHTDTKGRLYYLKDAKKFGISLTGYSGENIASAGIGLIQMDDNPHVYNNSNGKDMANMDEDEMVYHDQHSNWGHRYNTLNKHYTKFGVGVARHSGSNNYYLAENFSD